MLGGRVAHPAPALQPLTRIALSILDAAYLGRSILGRSLLGRSLLAERMG
jgi:hypothetical protein